MMIYSQSLQTERLELTPLSEKHLQGVLALWSKAEVCQYSGVVTDKHGDVIPTPMSHEEDAQRLIDFWLSAAQDGWGFRWATCLKGESNLIGTIGFNSLNPFCEIAFHLHPDYWGCGLMREACEATIKHMIKHGCRNFEAFIDDENAGSIALITRLGFEKTDEISDGARRYIIKL